MLTKPSTQLLNKIETLQKIRRIAFEVYERNFEEKEIIIAGINGEGYRFAEILVENLREISPIKIIIAKVIFDKLSPQQPDIQLISEVDTFKNKCVILTDDVLNTGKTLAFSLRPFLSIPLKKLQVAVMVDRNYPLYPISADYVGYSLSTTLQEHISVILSENQEIDNTPIGIYIY